MDHFPLCLIPGSGPVDMNETQAENTKPFWQRQHHSQGIGCIRYNKRGVGEGSIIVDTNVWGNMKSMI